MPTILIIDDEQSIRKVLSELLKYEGYTTDEAADGEEGLRMFSRKKYDVVLADIKMPKMDGIAFLEQAVILNHEIPIIIISGLNDIDRVVDVIKKGAYDFIAKPPDLNRILISIRNAIDKKNLQSANRILTKKNIHFQEIVGNSKAIASIKSIIEKVAATDARVLITGENGSGKELVARSIHEKSRRSSNAFVEVNCAAIPSELIESELFGHEKGSFTSAHKQRIGKFEQASGGSLFLDEVGDMSLNAQAKVLRALQESKITRVGADKDITIDVRIIAATNKNLLKEVKENRFRMDLYHRLGVIIIHVPSLNERKEDIPILTDYFLKQIAKEYGESIRSISPEAIAALQSHNWTGNIRELRNAIERLVILSGKMISVEDVGHFVLTPNGVNSYNTHPENVIS
jgi:two-component system nitrogen regulation response regulator NtrX